MIAIATFGDWLKDLAPVFQPMRSKKTKAMQLRFVRATFQYCFFPVIGWSNYNYFCYQFFESLLKIASSFHIVLFMYYFSARKYRPRSPDHFGSPGERGRFFCSFYALHRRHSPQKTIIRRRKHISYSVYAAISRRRLAGNTCITGVDFCVYLCTQLF